MDNDNRRIVRSFFPKHVSQLNCSILSQSIRGIVVRDIIMIVYCSLVEYILLPISIGKGRKLGE